MKAVTWMGFEAFKRQLTTMSPTLLEESDQILRDQAEAAKAEIVAAYRRGPTGNLKRGVKIRAARGQGIAGVDLKQTAPHGHLYEYGTKGKVRRYTGIDKLGRRFDRASRGVMEGTPTFGPIAAQHQRLALSAVSTRIQGYGATVEGEADVDFGAGSRLL